MKVRKDKGKVRRDLTGKKFSMLTVVSFDSWITQGKNTAVSYWNCKCECGNETKVKGTHLTRGDTKSCGCYNPGRLEKGEAAFNVVFQNYKRHAKQRGYEFFLSKDEFRYLTKQYCYYCGIEPLQSFVGRKGNGNYLYNGVDRVNNEPYYKVENTVSCCKLCNWMKADLLQSDFYKHIEKINERTKLSNKN